MRVCCCSRDGLPRAVPAAPYLLFIPRLMTPGGRSDFQPAALRPVRPISCPVGHRDCLQPQSRQFPASSSPVRKAPPRLPSKIQWTTPRLLLPLPRGRTAD